MQQRTEQDLAVTVRTFCVHTVVVQEQSEQDFAKRVLPSFSVPSRWGCPFSALPLLPAPEPALQGLVVPMILGEHPSQTPQALGIPR